MDLEALLAPIADDAPAGEDLEYDLEFGELARAAMVKPEQVIGDHVKEAEEPDWKVVRKQAEALFARTKDLRVAVHLTNALLRVEGWPGLRDGLELVRQLGERYWEGVHPRLDEDDGDPTIRCNAVRELANRAELVLRLLDTPFLSTRLSGSVCLRDLRVIAGRMNPKPGAQAPSKDLAAAAVREAGPDKLVEIAAVVGGALEALDGIEAQFKTQVGPVDAPDLKPLRECIEEVDRFLVPYLPVEQPAAVDVTVAEESASAQGVPGQGGGAVSARPVTGEVTSRDDVIRMLDLISAYYSQYEPSSPVPLLLRRARGLVRKSFLEILADLTPGGLSQAEVFLGNASEEGEPGSAEATPQVTSDNSSW